MKLYHYSDKKFDNFDFNYAGSNYYSRHDFKICGYPRFYFYTHTNKNSHERWFLKNKYCYILDIQDSLLYDIDKDIEGFKHKWNKPLEDLFDYIVKSGYCGIIYHNKTTVCLFKVDNIKIQRIKQ